MQSSHRVGILEGIGGGYKMVSWDWETLVKILVTPAQYAVWAQEYRDLASVKAIDN